MLHIFLPHQSGMFKRALGADAYSVKTRSIVEADEQLNPKQKRRVLNSLLPFAVLSTEQLNDFDETSDEEEEQVVVEAIPDDSVFPLYRTGEGSFRGCHYCPGKKMLTEEDISKHLESKQHLKKAKQDPDHEGRMDKVTAVKTEAKNAEIKKTG